ncbi:MAG: isovaleryl-CoA dehydrogenase [Verrucomicrobia bacterium]|nr:isovaleryl-CoA dehydrogenase [Verrucomicrobiota bacterium]
MPATHDVLNQPPPRGDRNLFEEDLALREAVAREGAAWDEIELGLLGAAFGTAAARELARQANAHGPVLHTHDRFGRRRDEVEFHPAWHEILRHYTAAELHCGPWREPVAGAHVARAAAFHLAGQFENGAQCPVTMTFAALPVLQRHGARVPGLQEVWLPRLLTPLHDHRFLPMAEKEAGLIGMGMTEKQGGSDVRANTTRAEPDAAAGCHRLTGHKWFCSAPMCDAFLVLAQAPGGLSCFFVPRFLPDGTRNALHFQRLKDKLGNRSNASSEVEFEGTHAWLLGEEGRGVPVIIEMVNHTRLDCVTGTAGIMRACLAEALHHARHRSVFGRRLGEQPLMQNVLADLALESEAATALALRLARTFDAPDDPHSSLLRRVLTPAAKYWVCKRGPTFAAEAMEVLGGSGYVEDSGMPRFYREMPVNSIWEGSGNVMCLDVLRALARAPEAWEALQTEVAEAAAEEPRIAQVLAQARRAADNEAQARLLSELMVLAVQAALLVQHAPGSVSAAFCASRLGRDGAAGAFGTLPAGLPLEPILNRAGLGLA